MQLLLFLKQLVINRTGLLIEHLFFEERLAIMFDDHAGEILVPILLDILLKINFLGHLFHLDFVQGAEGAFVQ